ncbi:MAG: alpha-hydroxy-acid oxidizing protein [Hyphomicrobiaceae bacterium]|nr:MAG: alpha-hydroxy-acid oxidizing protein [Hyphomicrobiaceae bacterium]
MKAAEAVNIEDLRRMARRRLPKPVFDFVDGGGQDERTLAANCADFGSVRFMPRQLVDVSNRRMNVRVLGQDLALPIILAPTGLTGLFGPGGEIAAARAAAAVGAGYCLSTVGTTSIESLADAAKGFWFQLYVQRDRGVTRELVQRAAAVGCPVLVFTTDTVVAGNRERDVRNNFSLPMRPSLHNVLQFASRPRWLWRIATGPRIAFANLVDSRKGHSGFVSIAQHTAQQFDPSISWKDVDWLKTIWPGRIAIKGILNPDDARRAVDHGADAVIVSNHGGRQLDDVPSTISALPRIVDAVGGRMEVLLDGGIRRGSDIVKALALGAKACLIGRAFLFGLAAGGEAGVARALRIFIDEIDRVQALLGCPSIGDIDRSFVADGPPTWPANR